MRISDWSSDVCSSDLLASKGRLGYGARVTEKKQNIALIVAAGRGERAGGSAPKQFRRIAGKTLLDHAIDAFSRPAGMDGVVLVIAERSAERRVGQEWVSKCSTRWSHAN